MRQVLSPRSPALQLAVFDRPPAQVFAVDFDKVERTERRARCRPQGVSSTENYSSLNIRVIMCAQMCAPVSTSCSALLTKLA